MADEPPAFNLDDIDFGPTMRGHQKGDRVFDRFVLQKLLGRGGMGVVWLAVDERLRRDVALKFAPQLIRFDEVAVEELKEETRKGLELAHPNIVKTYDFLLDEENAAISMEFIDGESLSGLRLKQPKRVFEVREIELWVSQILKALDYAHHSAGVIHRDLKPANLMVDRAGTLRVTDFGIARSISEAVNRATIGIGNSTGTLAYMSPQQADGRRPEITDDVYAFASTVYELLTGKPPFHSGNIGLQLRHEEAVSPTARRIEFGLTDCEVIPPAWEETLLACLQKDPTKRPANASELMQLLGLEQHSTVKSTRASSQTYIPPAATPPATPATAYSAPSTPPPATSATSARNTSIPLWKQDRDADAAARAAKSNPSGYTPPPVRSSPAAATSTASTASRATTSATTTSSSEGEKKKGGKGLLIGILVVAVLMMAGTGTAAWMAYSYLKEKGKPKIVDQNDPKTPVIDSDPHPTQDPPPSNNSSLPLASNDTPPSMPQPDSPPATPSNNNTPPPMTQDAPPAPAVFTIQDAINRAKRGDTITIPDGIYQEQVRLNSGIKLKAETPGKVVVQADGESGSALLSENCRDVSIEGLVFQHTGSEVASGKKWPVVYIKASSITITGCTIEKGVGTGMTVTGSGQVELKQCVFRNNVDHGLLIEGGSEALVTECEARKNGGSGVAVHHTGTQPTFTRCLFDGNGGSGAVVIDGGSAKIGTETIATNNVEAGVAADGDGSSINIDGLTCEGNLVGISVVSAAEGQVRRATLRNNKEIGVVFTGAGPKSVVEENVIEKNKLGGIFASNEEKSNGGSIRIANNQISLNGGDGIVVLGYNFKPEVTQNTCLTNASHGILAADGCSGSITANTLKGNHVAGVGNQGAAGDIAIRDNIVE